MGALAGAAVTGNTVGSSIAAISIIASSVLLWCALPPLSLWPLGWLACAFWIELIRRPALDGKRPYLVLWLELPTAVDAEKLFDDAIEAGISIAPGNIFSPSNRYGNFVRLGYGHPWSERTEEALRWLGNRVSQLSQR